MSYIDIQNLFYLHTSHWPTYLSLLVSISLLFTDSYIYLFGSIYFVHTCLFITYSIFSYSLFRSFLSTPQLLCLLSRPLLSDHPLISTFSLLLLLLLLLILAFILQYLPFSFTEGGCSCAGPFGHQLLGLTRENNKKIELAMLDKHEVRQPLTLINYVLNQIRK